MKYLFLVFIWLHAGVYGQNNTGPRLAAMGSGGTAIRDKWSLLQNPAGTAGLKRPALAAAYQQHLLDQDLSTQTALFIVPYRQNVIGLSAERYGFSEYTEQSAGISYARRFGDSFRLAIGARYYQLNISRYGSARALSVDAGFQLDVTGKFTIASHIANPNGSRYKDLPGPGLPVKLSFGASYMFNDMILMIADIRKNLDYPPDAMTGIEYSPTNMFSLRGGISASPFKQYIGFGLHYNNLQVDFSVSSHQSLGYSPQIALGYEF